MACSSPDGPSSSIKVHFKFKSIEIFDLDISDAEPLSEIRSLLQDHPFLRLHPNFRLSARGVRLQDGASLSAQVPKLDPTMTIDVLPDHFTSQTAERHVNQAAEFFLSPLFYLNEGFIDFNIFLGRPEFVQNMVNREEVPVLDACLADIVDSNVAKFAALSFLPRDPDAPRFFASLALSRFNPPGSFLRVQDDLFYLDLTTKEGDFVCLTVNKRGIFQNESTAALFSPKPASPTFHSLFDALAELSPAFKTDLDALVRFDSQESHDLLLNSPQVLRPPSPEHRTFAETEQVSLWTCALTQLRDSLSEYRNGTNLKLYRDWNEEFQSYRGLAVQDNMQQLQKTKILRKVYRDFSRSAQEVCRAIVSSNLTPVNQTDKKVEECYVFNNFFITFAEDRLDWETPRLETTPSTFANVNSDLRNLQQVYALDLPNVNVINTCAVDVVGLRLVVQTMITGILHFDQKTWNCYGSIDDGKTFNDNQEFAPIFEELCRNFKLKTGCRFRDAQGKEFTLHGSPEVKGIKAGDGRRYVMDLMKLSPRDLNYPRPKEEEGCLIRPELIRNFFFINSIEEMYSKNGEAKEAKEQAGEVQAQTPTQPADPQPADPQPRTDPDPKDEKKPSKFDYFNPNLACIIENEDDGLKAQELEQLKSLAAFITDNAIPFFRNELHANPTSVPIDMDSLLEMMHKYGINGRYLGRLTAQFDQPNDRFFRLLSERTILIRSLRKFFRRLALQMSPNELIQVIAHVLNCVLGDASVRAHIDQKSVQTAAKNREKREDGAGEGPDRHANGKKKKSKKKRTAPNPTCVTENNTEMLCLTSDEVFREVAAIAQARYRMDFTAKKTFDGFACLSTAKDKLSFLREFARSMGLVLAARSYAFGMPAVGFEYPLRFRDFVAVQPRLKCPNFQIEGLKYTYKSIESEINEKNFESALGMLQSCQSIILNTYGLFNSDFIYVTSKIAGLCFLKGQVDRAIRMQVLVVKVSERVFGLDNFNTGFAIIELSNYIFEARRLDTSVALHSLAVLIFDLIGGPLNPSSLLCLQEMHLLFAQTKKPELSAESVEELLRRNEKIFGETDEHLLFLLGKLAALKADIGRFKDASILQARKSLILKKILKSTPGENNDYARKIIDEKISDSEHAKNLFVQKYREKEAAAGAREGAGTPAASKSKAAQKKAK